MATPTNPGQMTYSQIEQLWIQAGGSPGAAPVMAAIALAESGGWPDGVAGSSPGAAAKTSTDANGGSYGLWMINGSHAGINGPAPSQGGGTPPATWVAEMNDPLANAREAVALYAGGAGLHNWSTYNNGQYAQFIDNGGASAAQLNAAANAAQDASYIATSKNGQPDPSAPAWQLDIMGFHTTIINEGQWHFIKGGFFVLAGSFVMLVGLKLLVQESSAAGLIEKVPGVAKAAGGISGLAP